MAAARAVDVGDMDLDVGDAVLEAGEPLADLFLEPTVAAIVAVDLIVGVDLDEHVHSPLLAGSECGERESVPDKIPRRARLGKEIDVPLPFRVVRR